MSSQADKNDSREKLDRNQFIKNQIHFKAKKKILSTPTTITELKRKLQPVFQEIRLLRSVNSNNVEEVKRLLESGVSPNSTDGEKRSALHVAVSKGYSEIVKLLLSYGADPNKRDMIQNTPLHLAACLHNFSIISMLINSKADVNCLDICGRNPLQLAASKLQILQRGWISGDIGMITIKEEVQQVIDLLLSVLMRGIEEKMEKMHQTDVDNLHLMKLSISSGEPAEIEEQMSKLLNDIDKFKIA